MTANIERVIVDCHFHTTGQATPRLPGYTLSLAGISALVRSAYPEDELARLLVLREEVGMLWTLRRVRRDKAQRDVDEHEDTLALARGARGKDKVMRDIHKLISEANWELSQADIQCNEGRLMAEAMDIDIPRCRALVVA